MQTTVTVSGLVTFGIHYRATRAAITRSRHVFAYAFFVGVPLLCVAVVLARGGDISQPSLLGLPLWVFLLLGPVFVFLLLPLIHVMNVWQRRRNNASIRGVLTFTVSPEGFASHGETFDVRLRWEAIHRVTETREFFFFYVAAGAAHFIPKACITSPAELRTIRTIVRAALQERAELQAN
jgi:hypothetical protein